MWPGCCSCSYDRTLLQCMSRQDYQDSGPPYDTPTLHWHPRLFCNHGSSWTSLTDDPPWRMNSNKVASMQNLDPSCFIDKSYMPSLTHQLSVQPGAILQLRWQSDKFCPRGTNCWIYQCCCELLCTLNKCSNCTCLEQVPRTGSLKTLAGWVMDCCLFALQNADSTCRSEINWLTKFNSVPHFPLVNPL